MLLHLSPGQRWSGGDKRDEEGYKQDECDALRSMNMQLREKCQSLQQEVNSLRLERLFQREGIKLVHFFRDLHCHRQWWRRGQEEEQIIFILFWTAKFCCIYLDFDLNFTVHFRKKSYLQGQSTFFNINQSCQLFKKPWSEILSGVTNILPRTQPHTLVAQISGNWN